jgi:hypothetical protein
MSRKRSALLAISLAMTSMTGTVAWADHGYRSEPPPRYGHHHYIGGPGLGWLPGVILGSALVWAATRPAVVQAEPPPPAVVVVPPQSFAPPPDSGWWYYCRPAGAYYPYVQSCPVPWERVPSR